MALPQDVVALLVTTFQELRASQTKDGAALKSLDTVMSTAEAVNVVYAAALEAQHFNGGKLTAREIAGQLQGVVLKDSLDDAKRVRHYFETGARARQARRQLEGLHERGAGTVAIETSELPRELRAAQAELAGCDGLYFAPVRHHSPACTLALRHLPREVRPSVVLVEGPDDLDHLLASAAGRAHPGAGRLVVPERAAAAGRDEAATEDGDDAGDDETERPAMRTSFFPFCDYSPEWLAIREGAAPGAQVALIDLPWAHKAWQAEHDAAGLSLMHERHYAHSRYLKAMPLAWAASIITNCGTACSNCVRRPHWPTGGDSRRRLRLVGDGASDYEPEVLEAELSLPRERQMAAHKLRLAEKCTGNIVVVTGGFHTQELISRWRQAGRPENCRPARRRKAPG